MSNRFYLLDTFTSEKFGGNPTPVCLLDQVLDTRILFALAREFSAPVSTFVEPQQDNAVYRIRYFTVTGEIHACGHATLGAAFALRELSAGNRISFETIDKVRLHARQEQELTLIEYPRYERISCDLPAGLMDALGIHKYDTHFYCAELGSYFVELESETEVKNVSPDFDCLRQISGGIKEVAVMSHSDNPEFDFTIRSFCPWIGIDEDPVTGSVHSVLGHYWQERLQKDEIVAFQASARGGLLFVRPHDKSVEIGGYARVIATGELVD